MANLKVKLPEDTDTLYIKSVSEDDEGKYFCKVTNELGSKEGSADIRVLSKSILSHTELSS